VEKALERRFGEVDHVFFPKHRVIRGGDHFLSRGHLEDQVTAGLDQRQHGLDKRARSVRMLEDVTRNEHIGRTILPREEGCALGRRRLLQRLELRMGLAYVPIRRQIETVGLGAGACQARERGVDVVACVAGAVSTPGLVGREQSRAPGTLPPQVVASQALAALGRKPRMVPGGLMRLVPRCRPRRPPRRPSWWPRISTPGTASRTSCTA